MANVKTTVQVLCNAGSTFVSPNSITLPDHALGFTKGTTLRDPDGHELLLVAP